jgi:hypothetical protein
MRIAVGRHTCAWALHHAAGMTGRSRARDTSEHASIFGTEQLAFFRPSIIGRLQAIDISYSKLATRASLALIAGLGTSGRKPELRFANSGYQVCGEQPTITDICHGSALAFIVTFDIPVEISSKSSISLWESISFPRSVRDFVHSIERAARTVCMPLRCNRFWCGGLADSFIPLNLNMYCCHLVRRRQAKSQRVGAAKPIPGTRVALVEPRPCDPKRITGDDGRFMWMNHVRASVYFRYSDFGDFEV